MFWLAFLAGAAFAMACLIVLLIAIAFRNFAGAEADGALAPSHGTGRFPAK
jgi:hypothetical protein